MSTTHLLAILSLTAMFLPGCTGNVKNARTVEVKINGNCDMCEESIEAAADQQGLSAATWEKDTRIATVIFDSTKTSKEAVLRRIANSGYDNEMYVAPDAAYANLPLCCQYERTGTTITPPAKGTSGHGH